MKRPAVLAVVLGAACACEGPSCGSQASSPGDAAPATSSATFRAGWARAWGGAASDVATSIAVGPTGDVFVAVVEPSDSPAGLGSLFVSKLDGAGSTLWTRRFDGWYFGTTTAASWSGGTPKVATDSMGNVILGATFVAGDAGSATLGLLVKLDTRGETVWRKELAGGSVQSIAVDAFDDLVAVGSFPSEIDLGGGALTSAGGSDVFVVKFDANGAHQWSERMGGASDDRALDASTEASGEVVVAGETAGHVRECVDVAHCRIVPGRGFVWKLGQHGIDLWTRALPGEALGVSGGPGGDAWVVGGSSDTGGVYVARLDSGGTTQWSRAFQAERARFRDVRVDAAGNVVVVGDVTGALALAGGAPIARADRPSLFLAMLDESGGTSWTALFPAGGGEADGAHVEGRILALDADDRVYVAGAFAPSLALDGKTLVATGAEDAFAGVLDR